MKKIIAFEGMPGAGKTTMIDIITKGSALPRCVNMPQLEISRRIDNLRDDLVTSKFYLDAERQKSAEIDNFFKKYDYILLDRTFLTTLAYCYARSKVENKKNQYRELLSYFDWIEKNNFLIIPDHVICLYLSIEESISRRVGFSKVKKYHYWFDSKFLYYFLEFYNKKNMAKFKIPKITFINVTKLSVDLLTERVLGLVKEK